LMISGRIPGCPNEKGPSGEAGAEVHMR
jgi:hypothetical protein